jgi:glycine/D-amino acid oxidase-like deaminating enzyme
MTVNSLKEKSIWWEDALPANLPDTALPHKTNVAVIGGGFAGLSAALELRRSGVEVTLIEKHWPGYGACSRNMGFVTDSVNGTTTGALNGLFNGVKRCDLIREGRRAHDHVLELISRENINCGLRQRGELVLATSKSAYEAMGQSLDRLEKHFGSVDAYVLPKQDLHREIGGRANKLYHGAKIFPNNYDLNPGQLTAGMIRRISELGVTICSPIQLDSVQRLSNGTFTISTDRGDIAAEDVVWATQGYSGKETGFLQKRIFPFLAHVVATEPIPQDLLLEMLPTLRSAADTKQMFFCFRPCDKDNRLVLASDYFRTDDNYTQSNRILNSYRKLFPELENVKAEYCWHGNLAATSDQLPHIGMHEGMYYCATGNFSKALYLGSKIAKRILCADDASTVFDNWSLKNFPFYNGNPSLLYRGLRMLFNGMDFLNIAGSR